MVQSDDRSRRSENGSVCSMLDPAAAAAKGCEAKISLQPGLPHPSLPQATVLMGKLEIIIFEEAVHEDDELTHTGSHGDERFFPGGQQAQIKLL